MSSTEGKRSWWIGRASNPVGGAMRCRAGSTPVPLRRGGGGGGRGGAPPPPRRGRRPAPRRPPAGARLGLRIGFHAGPVVERDGDVFGDTVVASALLDRLLHHAVVVQIEGASYRLRRHAELMPENTRARPISPSAPPAARRRGRPPKDREANQDCNT